MKALQYRKSIPRYALLKLVAPQFQRLYTSGLAPLALRDVPEPRLPTPQWVRLAPIISGVCGSDISTVCATGSAYLAPLTSLPFIMGHEVVARVTEVGDAVKDLSVGDRVVLHPALGCKVRGIEPMCDNCRLGREALCRNVTRGDIAKGIQTGFCRDTGGGFGDSLVAHRSQVYRVPAAVEDKAAVLVEPFACALHAAMRVSLTAEDTALVIGAGTIGLLTIAALRATGCKARIIAVAKYDHQRQHAKALGADDLLNSGGGPVLQRYRAWAQKLDAEVVAPELGKPTVIGGSTVTFDCVASSRSIDDGLRFTKSGGAFVLVGMPGVPYNVDWTPMWFKELTVRAAYAYGPERRPDGVHETFDMALDLMTTWGPRLAPLVGHPFELADHRAALSSALRTGESKIIKTAFALR